MQFIFAIAQATNFYLAAVKLSFADDAKTLVVERPPGSKSIFSTQDRQAIIEFEMCYHKITKSSLPITSKRTIGALDDRAVGKIPTTSQLSKEQQRSGMSV